MKKWLLVLSCVCAFSLVALIPLSAFAVDTSHIYEYVFNYNFSTDGGTQYRSRFPSSFVSASDCYSKDVLVWAKNDTVTFDYSGYDDFSISYWINGHGNPDENDDPYYLEQKDFPLVFYSYSATLTALDDSTITGIYVTPPETTSPPTAYGTSVSAGVTSGISYVGLVLSSIINSPVFIFVGLAVGCYLVTLSISKVKDLIKGY